MESLIFATKHPDTNDFDLLIALIREAREHGQQIPDWLANFAADVAIGKIQRPTKRGPDKYKNWERDYKLFRCVNEVSQKFSLPKYVNVDLGEQFRGTDTVERPTAAGIVSQASGLTVDVVITVYKKFSRLG